VHTTFTRLLRCHFNRAQLSYSKAAHLCWVDVGYLHRLVTGAKSGPSRDVVIRLAIGLGLTVPETDELLMAAGHAPLLQILLTKTRCTEQPLGHCPHRR